LLVERECAERAVLGLREFAGESRIPAVVIGKFSRLGVETLVVVAVQPLAVVVKRPMGGREVAHADGAPRHLSATNGAIGGCVAGRMSPSMSSL
jgi:hypothetical protein